VSRPIRVAGWEVDITHLNPPEGVTGDALARFGTVYLDDQGADPALTAPQARRLAAALIKKADELDDYRCAAAARVKAAAGGSDHREMIGSLWRLSSRGSSEVTELRLVRETKRSLKFEVVSSGEAIEFLNKAKALASGLLVPDAVPANGGRS
jgi:hypothetical protein